MVPGNWHKPDLVVKGKSGFSRELGILTPAWPRDGKVWRRVIRERRKGQACPNVPALKLVQASDSAGVRRKGSDESVVRSAGWGQAGLTFSMP